MDKKCKDRCAGCFFQGRSTGTCDYIFIVDQRRPCPPGDECTEFITRKEWDDQMNKARWNTELGRQMWLEGKKDSEIADEFGIKTSVVATYRKRHWEKILPQQTLNAIRKNAKEAGGKVLPAGARIETEREADNPSVAPTVQRSALEGMEPVTPAMIVGPGGPLAEMGRIAASPSAPRNDMEDGSAPKQPDPHNDAAGGCIPPVPVIIPKKDLLTGVRKQTPDVMDIMAAATGHLSGMKAVCTGCAIQSLWFWRNAEDLRQAKRNIDYLLQLLEGEQNGE